MIGSLEPSRTGAHDGMSTAPPFTACSAASIRARGGNTCTMNGVPVATALLPRPTARASMGAVDWAASSPCSPPKSSRQNFPLFVERCGLRRAAGAMVADAAGLGFARELKMIGRSRDLSLLSDGAVLPAFGIEGGLAAAPSRAHVRRGGQDIAFDTPGKVGGFLAARRCSRPAGRRRRRLRRPPRA